MQVKYLHNLIEELAGEGNGRISEILFNKKDVNEFNIAKKMNLTINQVRNILYKLSNYGLVSFNRKKDNKKGWYIYFWTLNSEKCLVLIEESLLKKIFNLEEHLKSRENDRYYICKACAIEVKEEQALEHGFSCEECADVYELADNSPHIRDIKSKITRLSNELHTIRQELEEVRLKDKKRRMRISKKEEKELEDKKALIKKARDEVRKKIKDAKAKELKKSKGELSKNVKSKTNIKKKSIKKTTKKKTVKSTPKMKKTSQKTLTKKKVSKKTSKK
jgi:transcription initiation factor TFIIE subunit alpha